MSKTRAKTKTAPKAAYTSVIPTSPLAYFWFVTKPYKFWATGSFLVVALAAGTSQATNYFFKLIVDAVESSDHHSVFVYALMYPVAIFVVQLLYRLSGYFGMQWTILVKQKGYNELCDYIFSHGHTFYADRFAGSVLSKINNVVSSLDNVMPEILWTHWNSLITFLVTFFFLYIVDPVTSYLFLVLVVVLFATNRMLAPRKTILAMENATANTVLRGRIVDVLSNISATRQYVRKGLEIKSINYLTEDLKKKDKASWFYSEMMMTMNVFILFIFALLMFWSLVHQWSLGNITTGDFILVLSLVAQITGTLIFIGRVFNATARSFGEMQEGLNDLVIPYDVKDKTGARKMKISEAGIVWKNVTFEYGENKVFNQFDLTIPAGQRVGLVGPSGAGKSTFVSLLLRQHDIDSGVIEIDGQDISQVTQDSLREQIAVVPQEPLLFHRSIRENIAYGKLTATDKEIIAVAKKAQAHDFIKDLPEGYDTLVGERGVKLSGGQKQRVAIARAMLKDAPILVLDEATSALDSESEVAIQKALHKLMTGKTVVAIAHRLSTLREMDRIIVLENGKIVEDGSHDALVNYGGVYARLWAHQAGGFLQE